ncbi:MAG: 50S ribosomal protein L32 [Phycisphaerae bacterium]
MLPVQKISKGRKRRRRSHHALCAPNLASCPRCQAARLPHAACPQCGYAGRKVMLRAKSEES